MKYTNRPRFPVHCGFPLFENKARYTATLVACRWAGAVLEKLSRASGQEQYAQKAQKAEKVKGDRQTNQPTDRRSNGRVFLYRHSTSELVFS